MKSADWYGQPIISSCEDCGLPYGDDWLDVVLSNEQWKLISGHSDGSGILCAGCIVKRAAKLGYFTVAKLELA